MSFYIKTCAIFLSLLLSGHAHADVKVNVVGLFSDKAVVIINGGKTHTMSVGNTSPEGVKLLSADSQSATFLIEGKKKTLAMGQAASVASADSGKPASVVLYADPSGHFLTTAYINGVPLKMLMDTGATSVAMNSGDAKYAGIDYKSGEVGLVQTANGNVKAYKVTINSLKLGAVQLNQVEGMVLEGGSPSVVLLGMSALNRLDSKREGIALTLTKKY